MAEKGSVSTAPSPGNSACFRGLCLATALAIAPGILGPFNAASAQVDPAVVGGIRHEVMAQVTAESRAATAGAREGQVPSNIRISVKIVEFTPDTRFYSVVTADFGDVLEAHDGAGRPIWADTTCHRDRGLPKVSLLSVEGTIEGGLDGVRVSATPRRIGQRIPNDEIIVQKQVHDEGASSSDLDMVALTKASRLRIRLSLISRKCNL